MFSKVPGVVWAFLAFIAVTAGYMGIASSPFLSSLNWGMIAFVTIICCLIGGGIWAAGPRKFILGVVAVIALIVVAIIVSAVSSQNRINEEQRKAAIQAQATGTAMAQELEQQQNLLDMQAAATTTAVVQAWMENTPPEHVYHPILDFGDLAWPLFGSALFVIPALLVCARFKAPMIVTSLVLLAVALVITVIMGQITIWLTTVALTFLLVGGGKLLYRFFSQIVGVFVHYANQPIAWAVAALIAYGIYLAGASPIWTVFKIDPMLPEQWVAVAISFVPSLMVLGSWKTPPK